MNLYAKVIEFHRKHDVPLPELPTNLDEHLIRYRLNFLQEELDELSEALYAEDIVGAADALVDLVYVALGTAAFMGLPFNVLFEVVHEANLTKVRAPVEETKRGHVFDLVKPADFVDPKVEIKLILENC
jgi:predicted HAD superfamily Cof-like phosphohydrolase